MSEKTNLDWKKYESITKYIYETLGKESGVKIEGYGNNCKVKGKSGVNHQIDVLTNHSDGINKGVIVSKSGFTPDGISFAKHRNIGLVELREIEEKDWEGRGRIFDIKTWINRPEILETVVDAVDKTELGREVIEIDKVKIELLDGNKIPFIDYVVEDLSINDNKINKITIYPNPTKSIINIDANGSIIEEIAIINLQGIVLKNIPHKNKIDVSELATGLYFIKLSVNGKIITKKFIK